MVDGHAVVEQRDSRVGDLVTRVVKAGGREPDVIGLPNQRRQAHVHVRRLLAVQAAAFVGHAFQAERVQDLHLVALLDVDAAVAASLAGRIRHVRQSEFQVQTEIVDGNLGHSPDVQQPVFGDFGSVELVGRGAVKQNQGVARRSGVHRRTDALPLGQRAAQPAIAAVDGRGLAVRDHRPAVLGVQHQNVVAQFACQRLLCLPIPAGAGQSAAILDGLEFAVAARDDLQAGPKPAPPRLEHAAGIFALVRIVGVHLGRVGDRQFACVRRRQEFVPGQAPRSEPNDRGYPPAEAKNAASCLPHPLQLVLRSRRRLAEIDGSPA